MGIETGVITDTDRKDKVDGKEVVIKLKELPDGYVYDDPKKGIFMHFSDFYRKTPPLFPHRVLINPAIYQPKIGIEPYYDGKEHIFWIDKPKKFRLEYRFSEVVRNLDIVMSKNKPKLIELLEFLDARQVDKIILRIWDSYGNYVNKMENKIDYSNLRQEWVYPDWSGRTASCPWYMIPGINRAVNIKRNIESMSYLTNHVVRELRTIEAIRHWGTPLLDEYGDLGDKARYARESSVDRHEIDYESQDCKLVLIKRD